MAESKEVPSEHSGSELLDTLFNCSTTVTTRLPSNAPTCSRDHFDCIDP